MEWKTCFCFDLGISFIFLVTHQNRGKMHLALVFFAVGIIVRFFPNILAGYSQLSQRERENTKANGLPAFASTVFVIMVCL